MKRFITWLMLASCFCVKAREMPIYNGKLTSALNANGHSITNVPTPVASSDAVNKAYVDGIGGVTPEVVTNAVRTLVDASFVGGTNAVNAAVAAVPSKQDLLPYATNAIPAAVVANAPWLLPDSLSGYATEMWVRGYAYAKDDAASKEWVQDNYITTASAYSDFATKPELAHATEGLVSYYNGPSTLDEHIAVYCGEDERGHMQIRFSSTTVDDLRYTPSAADPTFSNAVLSVGLGVDTNVVAELNAMLGGLPPIDAGTGATTVGGLLAALVAAVVWLKRNKAAATHAAQHAFGGADALTPAAIGAANDTDVRYGYATAAWGGAATDGAVNRLPTVTTAVTITAPTPTSGKTGDFVLRFAVNAASAPTVTVAPPTGGTFTPYAISGDEIGTTGEYEMLVQLVPTATAGTYDYIECVRKIST